jgi:hypothetical protein
LLLAGRFGLATTPRAKFDVDELLLVDLDSEYQLIGIWSLPLERAKASFLGDGHR